MESLTSIAHDLQLLRNETRHEISRLEQAANTAYALTMAIVLLFMQAGFAMLEVGSVRERAVRDVLFKNMVDISVAAIAWFLLGYLLYSDTGNPFIGMPEMRMTNITVTPFAIIEESHKALHGQAPSRYLLSFMFAATSATILGFPFSTSRL